MSSDKVVVRRLRKLLVEQQTTLASLQSQIQARLAEVDTLTKHLNWSATAIESAMKRGESRLKELDQWRDDPVVLVRTSPGGYGLPVYHDGENPCGYVGMRSNYKEMLLGEAEAAGHGPCVSCGWYVKRRRDAA